MEQALEITNTEIFDDEPQVELPALDETEPTEPPAPYAAFEASQQKLLEQHQQAGACNAPGLRRVIVLTFCISCSASWFSGWRAPSVQIDPRLVEPAWRRLGLRQSPPREAGGLWRRQKKILL